MNVEHLTLRATVIEGYPALDPVTVVFRDAGPGRGGILVECYGKAWSAFWGAMGDKTVREFIASCGADYIACKLWRDGEKRTKSAEEYLMRVSKAVIAATERAPCIATSVDPSSK